MTRIVSPEEFNAAFLQVARRRKAAIQARLYKPRAFTKLLLNESDGVLAAVAKKLGLQYCKEYFLIDAIMCERIDADNFDPEAWFAAEQFTVVIEHENNVGGANKEMNKLSIYNSPLKVLITYPWVSTADRCLTAYADILRRADVFNDFTTLRRHVVIFGFGPEQDVSWESYVYRRGKFMPLEVTP